MATGLGRGLNSLIPQKVNKVITPSGEAVVATVTESEKNRVLELPLEQITVNHLQPRKNFSDQQLSELVDSIKLYGVIQPVIVTPRNGAYELIAGERRLRASKALGKKTIPAIVRETEEQEMLEVALIENIQRENLNPVETAIAYQKLAQEFNLNQDELAKRLGKSRPTIANTLRLLTLPEEIQLGLIQGKISEGHAKLILGIDGEVKQMNLYRKIVHGSMSVSDTAKESRTMGGTKQARVKINYQDKDKEFVLREALGAKVEIKRKANGGQIVVEFFDEEELQTLIDKIKK